MAHTWLKAFGTCVLMMLPVLWWSWLTPAPYGDLTRIGNLSESSFGWRDPQLQIAQGNLRSVPLRQADVLVIGDSFSAPLLWQSRLVEQGLRVTTWHWDSIRRICNDLEPWLRSQGFMGRAVVLQRVERELPNLIKESQGCPTMMAHQTDPNARHLTEQRILPPVASVNWKAPSYIGPLTSWNSWRALQANGDFVTRGTENVRVASVPGGCKLFSHAACTRSLFLAADMELTPVTLDHLMALPGVHSSSPSLAVIWAVTPNKSTIYLQSDRAHVLSTSLKSVLEGLGYGPDLFGLLLANRDEFKDLYLPNDTHLSVRGYQLMGTAITQFVAKVMPPDQAAKR